MGVHEREDRIELPELELGILPQWCSQQLLRALDSHRVDGDEAVYPTATLIERSRPSNTSSIAGVRGVSIHTPRQRGIGERRVQARSPARLSSPFGR